MMVPGDVFICCDQAPNVSLSIKVLIRYSLISPVSLFSFTPSTYTQLQMSILPRLIFRYFLSFSRSARVSSSSYSSSSSSFSNMSLSGSVSISTGSPEASRSLKTLVTLVAVTQVFLIWFSSIGMLLVVFSLTINKSRQLSSLASSEPLQLSSTMLLPSFSISMFQGQTPPLMVSRANRKFGWQMTLKRSESSFSVSLLTIFWKLGSLAVDTGSTSQTLFSLNLTDCQETLSTRGSRACTLPIVFNTSTWQSVALGKASSVALLIVFRSFQSFLTVIFLKLVLIWLCQGLRFFLNFLVMILMLVLPGCLRSQNLMCLEMWSLSFFLAQPSTMVQPTSSCLGVREVRLQYLALLQKLYLLENPRGMWSNY